MGAPITHDEVLRHVASDDGMPVPDCFEEVTTTVTEPDAPRQRLSLLDGKTSAERKEYPLITGCLDYFRDALLMVSNVSYKGNVKHNGPESSLQWARSKSTDEIDALGRHLVNRFEFDTDLKIDEAAEMCWRSLAFYQKLLEVRLNIKPPPSCK